MTKGTNESLTKVAHRSLLVSTALGMALTASTALAQNMGGAFVTSARPDIPQTSTQTGPKVSDRPSEMPSGTPSVVSVPTLPVPPSAGTPTVSSNRPDDTPAPIVIQIIANTPTMPSTPGSAMVVARKPGEAPVMGGGGTPGQGGGDGGDDPDPDRPTDIPTGPTLPTFDGIGLSALAPPENVTVTQAVEIVAGPVGDEQFVQATGQTLFGAVQDPGAFDMVEVMVQPSGRTAMVDVSPNTGQFAARVFEDDFGNDGSATVNLTAMNSTNDEVQTESVSYTLQQAMPEDGFVQALSRVTYGATPQLYARVASIGFEAYVEEQLNPDTINDSFFESLNFDSLINRNDTNVGRLMDQVTEHNLAHASYSEKQLQELMGEFWSNHFHASDKGASMSLQTADDREFFRENAFGNFSDLLKYSARSPLMSRFLDNTDNRRGNINENYGREILELHTVGVDGGYDDDDVIAVSRVFTGWTYDWVNDQEPARSSEPRRYVFEFRADRHDTDDKVVDFLGITITGREGAQGVEEGDELIDALSNDPRTQNYVCGKIVQKFVSDAPPQSFVDNCVAAWAASNGNSAAILRAILLDPEFINNPGLQRTKAKTPFEFAASFVRAFDFLPPASREDSFFRDLREAVTTAGFNPVRFPVPTGLPEVGAAWLNSATLIEQYQELTGLADDAEDFGSDLQALILAAGLETAEETAAYMLAIATADRYREEEYNAVVAELKGTDGFFEPATEDETRALRRAIAVITSSPSFHLQ